MRTAPPQIASPTAIVTMTTAAVGDASTLTQASTPLFGVLAGLFVAGVPQRRE
ncbi:MAG: hypothetical protein MJ014_05245 [Methanocorpusculum sp.]|nr:hypothetical protein [Methanocorpusculum sp.]